MACATVVLDCAVSLALIEGHRLVSEKEDTPIDRTQQGAPPSLAGEYGHGPQTPLVFDAHWNYSKCGLGGGGRTKTQHIK
jgi:hypothetical protein